MKEYNYNFYAYIGTAIVLAIILVFGLIAVFQPAQMLASAQAHHAEAVERGTEVFEHDCETCHGSRGEGVRNSGPALNTKEFLAEATDEIIFNTINDGRPGTSMPAWGQSRGGPYNPQMTEDLVAFIRAWEPTAPSIEEIPYLGDPVEGTVLFATTCYACHGIAGEGTAAGLRLNDPELLAKYDDDYFRDVIANGRPERGMPTWGSVLSPIQIEDMVTYIRSWENEAPIAMANLGGDATKGEIIFTSTCVVCHGFGGNGTTIAPPLAEASILDDAELLYDAISEGRLNDGMPNWGQVLSPAEINDVITYLGALKAAPVVEGGNAANGARIYAEGCVTCHGLSGEGVAGLGSALRPSEIVATLDNDALSALILEGHGDMPGQAGIISVQDVNDLISLLRSWEGEAAEEPAAVEEKQDDAATQFLYLQECAICHGLTGEGKKDRPPLVNNEFIQNSDDDALLDIIANGRPNTAMESLSEDLSEEEMMALVELIKSWQ